MNLKEQINSDFIIAYKAHDELRVSVLRMIKSSVQNAEIAQKAELDDSNIVAVLKKEIKQRKDSVEAYKDAGRVESAEQEEKEMEIISAYLPSQMSEEDIRKIAEETIGKLNASGMQDMGKVIGVIMREHGDSVDGGVVSAIVKELLSK